LTNNVTFHCPLALSLASKLTGISVQTFELDFVELMKDINKEGNKIRKEA